MNPIASIIRRNLLASRAIEIPSFGTIFVEKIGAAVVDGGLRLASPVKVLSIDDSEAVSIIDYIAEGLEVDQTQAMLQYNEWIDHAADGHYLNIEGVAAFEIAGNDVVIDPNFALLLNPAPNEKIVIKRNGEQEKPRLAPSKNSNTFMVVLSVMAAITAAAYLIYYFFDDLKVFVEKFVN